MEGDEGAEFYSETPDYSQLRESLQQDRYSGEQYFNDFGSSLYVGNRWNIAPLRTVGAKDGVTMTSAKFEAISGVDQEKYIRELAKAAKKIWESFISNTEIKAIITFEI